MIIYPGSTSRLQPEDRSVYDSDQSMALTNYYLGLNLNLSSKQIEAQELTQALNWKYKSLGKLVTREGLTKVTTASVGVNKQPVHLSYVPSDTTSTYAIVYDTSSEDYTIHRLTGTSTSLTFGSSLGTLSGDAIIVPFNGYGIVLDGSYIKTVKDDTLAIAYDDGEADSGFQYATHCEENDASTDLYDGGITRCGGKITTQIWDAGYTIPLTQIEMWLSKTGSPTGEITAYLYNSTGSTLLATSLETVDASSLTTNGVKRTFAFDLDDTYDMTPSTEYLCVVGYGSGNSSNYVSVYATAKTSGGNQYQYSGSWSAVTTKDPIIGVKPGKPPKGSFGDVKDTRLFVSGDPDNPGYVWFSNTGTVLDWCTVDGGGWVGAVDDNANNYEVGAILAYFGDLYVFGKKEQPFLCKLTGSIPSEFSLPPLFQEISTTHKCLLSVVNDVWFASRTSVNTLSGVNEYGDVRAFNVSEPIEDVVTEFFDEHAFAGYDPISGQFLLKLNGYDDILVCHTRLAVSVDSNTRYPWTIYNYKDLVPTTFNTFNTRLYVGCSDGNIYTPDSEAVKDGDTLPDYSLASGVIEVPFGNLDFSCLYSSMDSTSWSLLGRRDISFNASASVYTINSVGEEFQVSSLPAGSKIYVSGPIANVGRYTVDNATVGTITVLEALSIENAGEPVSISLDYGDLTLYKDGLTAPVITKTIGANESPRREQLNFTASAIQWSIGAVQVAQPIRFTGLTLLGDKTGPLL